MKVFVVAMLLACTILHCYAQGQCYDPSIDFPDTLPGPELLQNGGFEQYGTYPWFSSDPEGFDILPYVPGACGSFAASIDTFYTRAGCPRPNAGIYQQVKLQQTTPKRVFVTGWGSGVNVSGVADVDFSLYVDVWFTDGTTHYGIFTPFPINSGFNRVVVTVNETKPIDYIFVNLVFRRHTGNAYFDLISVKEEVILVYPEGVNILQDPSFEACNMGNWTQQGGATCQIQACGNKHVRTGSGSLSTGSASQDSCFTQIYQLVYFNPPITPANKLVFSAYVYISYDLDATVFDFVDLTISDGIFNVNITNIPFVISHGFKKYEVTLTPTGPLGVVQVELLIQGKSQGVTYDDASLVLL